MIIVILGVHHDFWPSPWFCVTAVIIGRLCTKSTQWSSFSDANLAVQLMVSFSATRLRLRVVYDSICLFIQIFFAVWHTKFSHFHGILMLYAWPLSFTVLLLMSLNSVIVPRSCRDFAHLPWFSCSPGNDSHVPFLFQFMKLSVIKFARCVCVCDKL